MAILCKCIHIRHGNMDEEYKMGDDVLSRTTQEKDLGVTVSDDMEVSEQTALKQWDCCFNRKSNYRAN